MITIGIDPGIERIGIGIVENNNSRFELLFHSLIKTSSKLSHAQRLLRIYDNLSEIMLSNKIEHASVEKLYYAKNVKTAMNVSEARGVILLVLQQHNIPIFEYTPLQVKQSLIGYGRAGKNQIQDFVKIMLNLNKAPEPDDVADGIALAIIHMNTYKTLSKIRQNIRGN